MTSPLVRALALDHIGIAAHGGSSALTALLGVEVHGRRMASGVEVGRFGPGGKLELVWEHRAGSPIAAFLTRRGSGLHHLALRVPPPIEDVRERLIDESVRLATGRVERSSDGRRCLFIHPASTGGVLVELVEGC